MTPEEALKEFYKLLKRGEDFYWSRAKDIAIEYNFSDELVADAIRPYKKTNYQLKLDSFWGAEDWIIKLKLLKKTDPTDPNSK